MPGAGGPGGDTPPPETGDTHPTGMHSCCEIPSLAGTRKHFVSLRTCHYFSSSV